MKTRQPAPACPYCSIPTELVSGEEIYGHRPELAKKRFWLCPRCDAYVGCHPGSSRPLGIPADAETRSARMKLHNLRFDPIWMAAERCGAYTPEDPKAIAIIRRTARTRLYRFLGHKLGLPEDKTHTGMFDLETCRRAWVALQGVTYADVRAWYKAQPLPPPSQPAAAEPQKENATCDA